MTPQADDGTQEDAAPRPALGYVAALLAVSLAFAAWALLAPAMEGLSPHLLFVPAVLIAAAAGGLGPGMLATALSLILCALVGGRLVQAPSELVSAALFAAIGIGIAWSGEIMRRHRARAVAGTRAVLAREAHLQSILDTVPDAMVVIDDRGPDPVVQHRGAAAVRLHARGGARHATSRC